MIYSCPICGKESGVTHGDQLWVSEVCEECQALTLNDEKALDEMVETDIDPAREGKEGQ